MRRGLGLLGVAVLAATVLSGCTPPPSAQVAIRLGAGGAELEFAPCPGERVHDIFLMEEETTARHGWHISGGPDAPVLTAVPLFSRPDRWIVADDTLTALDPGITYVVTIYAGSVRKSDVHSVTVSGVESLAAGQVLGRGDAGRAAAMTEADFRDLAAKGC